MKQAKLFYAWKRASIKYNQDCNIRFLGRGKTDAKRERLRRRAREAFEAMMKALDLK